MSGKYRHFITIENPSDNPDDPGNPTYKPFAEAWARISPIGGDEEFAFAQIIPLCTHKIELYYQPGIKPTARITHDDRHFFVKYIINVEERDFELKLIAVERL
jgi:head-tail adaptor